MSSRYQGRHRAARRTPLNPHFLGTGLVLPAAATVAVVASTSGAPTSVALARSQQSIGSTMDRVAVAADLSELADGKAAGSTLNRAVQARAARDAERWRTEAVLAENHRRATYEDTVAATEEVVEITATGAMAPLASSPNAVPAVGPRSWVKPVNGSYVKTSPYGPRWGSFHKGQDLAVPVGTPIYALSSGVVVFTGYQGSYGLKVEVKFWDGTVAYYAHNSRITVRKGQEVSPGEVIAYSGNTGNSTGPHLHLEIRPKGGSPVNPMPWLAGHGIAM